jgi:hypothetical protein
MKSRPVPRYVLVSAGAALLFLGVVLYRFSFSFATDQYDDAYITYRYAHHWATGHGLVFNPGERVSAASSFLFAALLAAAERIGFSNHAAVASTLNLVAGCALIAIVALAAFRIARSHLLLMLPAVLPFAVGGAIAGWTCSGMETTFFIALFAASGIAYFSGFRRTGLVLAGLAAICRLEGLIVLLAIGVDVLVRSVRTRSPRSLVIPFVLGCLPFIALLCFYFAFYGSPVPHALRFKRVATYYHWKTYDHFAWILGYCWKHYPILLAGWVFSSLRWMVGFVRAPSYDWKAGLFVTSWIAFVAIVVGPYADHMRYGVLLMPMWALATTWGLATTLPSSAKHRWLQVVACLALLAGVYPAWRHNTKMRDFQLYCASHSKARAQLGKWLAANAGDQLVASSDIGVVAYHAPRQRFLDVLGLTSPGVVDDVIRSRRGPLRRFTDLRPTLIADTVHGGTSQTEMILSHPERTFAGVQPEPPPPFSVKPLFVVNAGIRFEVRQVTW